MPHRITIDLNIGPFGARTKSHVFHQSDDGLRISDDDSWHMTWDGAVWASHDDQGGGLEVLLRHVEDVEADEEWEP